MRLLLVSTRLFASLLVTGLLVTGLLATCLIGVGAAQTVPAHEDADACQADIHRLCDKFFPDEKLVATCLVDRRSELSEACAEVLARPASDEPKLTNRAQ